MIVVVVDVVIIVPVVIAVVAVAIVVAVVAVAAVVVVVFEATKVKLNAASREKKLKSGIFAQTSIFFLLRLNLTLAWVDQSRTFQMNRL